MKAGGTEREWERDIGVGYAGAPSYLRSYLVVNVLRHSSGEEPQILLPNVSSTRKSGVTTTEESCTIREDQTS